MDRPFLHELISRRYHEVHGAIPEIAFGRFISDTSNSSARAVLGYCRADRQPLFLETYLDRPIEAELTEVFGRPIWRNEIVEIGNLASDNALATVQLWAATANDLGGEAEIAVAVLTRQLRTMFRKLGLTLYEIASARPDRLSDRGARWGSYYQQDPVVCAGLISDGQARLSTMLARRERKSA